MTQVLESIRIKHTISPLITEDAKDAVKASGRGSIH